MSDLPKEKVYDEQIAPLMSQIIAICKRHKIANLCSFDLGWDEDAESELCCTTALLEDEYEPQPEYIEAMRIILRQRPSFLAMTITKQKERGDEQ